MNTKLTVKKVSDTNFVPVMYGLIEMTPASTAAATYCVISTIRVGWDTEVNFENWKYDRKVEGMQGKLGELEVVALTAIEQYRDGTPSSTH